MSNSSRFGLNIFLQLILAFCFYVFGQIVWSSTHIPALSQIFSTLASITWLSFILGLIYGFFRLFGARGRIIEHYYQNFPIGFTSPSASSQPASPTNAAEPIPQKQEQASKGFEWDDLFSPRYLRYAGLILIISAGFSLLFRIDWQLIHKIIASLLLAFVGGLGAEYFRKKSRTTAAALCFIIAFAAFQFGITLSAKYYFVGHEIDPTIIGSTALAIKFLIGLAGLFLLKRYGSDFAPGLYFTILYIAPLSLVHSDLTLQYLHLIFYIGAVSLTALQFAYCAALAPLMVLNVIIANIYIIGFVGFQNLNRFDSWLAQPALLENARIALIAVLVSYVAQIVYSYMFSKRYSNASENAQVLHVLAVHVMISIGICTLMPWVPAIAGQYGLALLALSIPAFVISLQLSDTEKTKQIASAYLFVSLVMSTLGLFLETQGPWTAVVFLFYSCGMLWYSLVFGQRTTRIFAFLALTASLFKLYTECGELFDSVPGSVAVLVVGGVLLVLANKMDTIKDLMKR